MGFVKDLLLNNAAQIVVALLLLGPLAVLEWLTGPRYYFRVFMTICVVATVAMLAWSRVTS